MVVERWNLVLEGGDDGDHNGLGLWRYLKYSRCMEHFSLEQNHLREFTWLEEDMLTCINALINIQASMRPCKPFHNVSIGVHLPLTWWTPLSHILGGTHDWVIGHGSSCAFCEIGFCIFPSKSYHNIPWLWSSPNNITQGGTVMRFHEAMWNRSSRNHRLWLAGLGNHGFLLSPVHHRLCQIITRMRGWVTQVILLQVSHGSISHRLNIICSMIMENQKHSHLYLVKTQAKNCSDTGDTVSACIEFYYN